MSGMITVEEALARVLSSAGSPLEEEKIVLRSCLRPCARARHQGAQDPAAVRQLGHGRLCGARRRHGQGASDLDGDRANRLRAALSLARSVRARRCASSPARRCPRAPTRSSFRRMSGARATASGSRPPPRRRQSARGRHGLPRRRRPDRRRPPSLSPRRGAGGGGEPHPSSRPPARPGRDPGHRRRIGCARRDARPGPDRRVEQLRRRRARRGGRRGRHRSRHRRSTRSARSRTPCAAPATQRPTCW